VELNPSSELVTHSAWYYNTLIGRYDEASRGIKRWRTLYPTNPNYFGPLSFLILATRDYANLARELEREGIIDAGQATHRQALSFEGVADVLQGRTDRAATMCNALVVPGQAEPRVGSNCGFVLARAGDTTRGEAILKGFIDRRATGEYVDPFLIAAIYAGLNRRDDVFAALKGAADEHSSLIVELTAAPWLDAFHDDARYQALVQRIGFPKP
jgi:hypothetical protein